MMHWNTGTPRLRTLLEKIMVERAFDEFRLVGGTSLSLQLGHRKSVDIDLFTDAEYGSIDFGAINKFFGVKKSAEEVKELDERIGLGSSYYSGSPNDELVKVDIYYTDSFIRAATVLEGIRMASLEDIIAMKLEIMGRSGRKKDFWDIHETHQKFSIPEMLAFYIERYPYSYNIEDIKAGLTNFTIADDDFDPVCLQGKYWELIKLDFVEWLEREI